MQGVFFRASTQQRANALGLTGWVRNCKDGSVELIACGEAASIEELVKWLWQGPEYAQVSDVKREISSEQEFRDFSIRY